MSCPQGVRTILLGTLALVLWIVYFMICYAPKGAPFIYGEY